MVARKEGSQVITVRDKVPREKFLVGTLFVTVNFNGTYRNLFYCTYFYLEQFFLGTNSQNYGSASFL
jgi:hypothetical protein